MKRFLPMLALTTTLGCGPGVTNPMPDIPETVEYDTVRIEYGEDDLVEASTMGMAQALVGDPSQVANISRGLVRGTNLIIRDQLLLIREVVKLDPTAVTADTWVWDNARFKRTDERFSRFEIEELEPGRYGYEWRVGNTVDEMLEIFSGEFSPRNRADGRQRGSGLLRFNFDNIREVDPESNGPRGRAAVAFRVVGGVRQVRVATFDLVETGQLEPRNSILEYVELPDGPGRMRFATSVDFLQDGEPFESLAIDAVWTRNAQGRALSSLKDGSLTVNEVLLHECWDSGGAVTFADATPDLPPAVNYEDGEESACVERLLQFELDPPEFAAPQADPMIPSAHPDESE